MSKLKTEPNDPIEAVGEDDVPLESFGITKREFFAAQAMKGILAGEALPPRTTDDELASMAINLADSLIKQLNKHE